MGQEGQVTEINPSDWLRLPGKVGGALAAHVHLFPALDGAAHVERDLAPLLHNVHNNPEDIIGVLKIYILVIFSLIR